MPDFDPDEQIRRTRERVNLFGTHYDRRTGSTVSYASVSGTEPVHMKEEAKQEQKVVTEDIIKVEPVSKTTNELIVEKEQNAIYFLGGTTHEIGDDTLWGLCFLAEQFLKKEQIHQFNEVYGIIKGIKAQNRPLSLTRINAYLDNSYNEYSKSEPLNIDDSRLFNLLRQWRYDKSKEEGLPPYCIAHDKTLRIVVKDRPTSLTGLSKVKGFGNKKVSKYGNEIMAIVNSFAR